MTPSSTLNAGTEAPSGGGRLATSRNLETARPVRPEAALSDMEELFRENRWPEVVEAYFPLAEKRPDLAAGRLETPVRSKLAFALGQLGRFDEAIEELTLCVKRFPGNFQYQASLAYTAYSSLWAAKNKAYFLSGEDRKARVELGHVHFRRAQEIRPDGVTNFYREGMLFYRLEDKPEKAFPLFRLAVANWEGLSDADRQARHPERKNYVKALYQGASAALKLEQSRMALTLIEKCIACDEASNHMDRLFKFFALGKVRHHLGDHEPARDALRFALKVRKKDQPADFVHELLARTYLALNDPERAEKCLAEVPENRLRPYIRWTAADVFLALGKPGEARKTLLVCVEKDRQARHKALIRLAKIEYEAGAFENAGRCAMAADRFFREKWGNPYVEGLYWQALAALGLKDEAGARQVVRFLATHFPESHRLRQLQERIS